MNAFAENLGVLPPQSHEAEQSVLGGLILDGSKLLELKLVADDFYGRPHRLMFTAMQTLAARRDNIDFLTVMNEMEVNGTIEDVGGHAYLGQVAKLTPSAANIKAYARIVKDNSLRRQAIAKYNEAIEAMMTTELTTNEERFEAASRLLGELEVARSSGMHKGAASAREIALKWTDELEERSKRKAGEVVGFTTGFADLDAALYPKGVLAGALVAVGARPKMGKEQPMHSKILLADGSWTTMGEIAIGDKLASVDGKPSVVTGIFPQGKKKTYRVTFTDGRSAECGIEHLWTIRSSRFKGDRTVNTADIIAMLGKERYQGRITVPSVSGDFGGSDDIGVNPWLLGALLGDGGLSGATPKISCSEKYIIERVIASLPYGISMNYDTGVDYRLAGSKGKPNPLTESLKNIGVHGVKSSEKKIPEAVFSSNRKTTREPRTFWCLAPHCVH